MREEPESLIINVLLIFLIVAIGLGISNQIKKESDSRKAYYERCVKIDNQKSFDLSMVENVGDCLIQGTMTAKKPIIFDNEKYSYLICRSEIYTTYTDTRVDSDGHVYTQVKHRWETIDRETQVCDGFIIYGSYIQSYVVNNFPTHHIKTVSENSHTRKVYYGCNDTLHGTLEGKMQAGILIGKHFYINKTIENITDTKINIVIVFWIIYAMIFAVLIAAFNDKKNMY